MKRILITTVAFFILVATLQSQVRIRMNYENGVYTTPCVVNGLRLRFIFDTGASNVSISLSEALFMLKNGYLSESDLSGSSYSQIANGDIIENTSITLKELEVGGIKLYNIKAIIIHDLSAPLLLGQTAIQKLGKIQIEGNELIILNGETNISVKPCIDAANFLVTGNQYEKDELFSLAAELYQKSYDLCPENFSCWDFLNIGRVYSNINNYSLAINFLQKAVACNDASTDFLYYAYASLSDNYKYIQNYDDAILNLQKSYIYADDDFERSNYYFSIGDIFAHLEKYYESNKNYIKGMDFYLLYINSSYQDLIEGKVNNQMLGEVLWNISINHEKLNEIEKSRAAVCFSALSGYESAISYCESHRLDYKGLIKKNK